MESEWNGYLFYEKKIMIRNFRISLDSIPFSKEILLGKNLVGVVYIYQQQCYTTSICSTSRRLAHNTSVSDFSLVK